MILVFIQAKKCSSYLEEIQCRLFAFILKYFSILSHLNVDTVRNYFFCFLKKRTISSGGSCSCKKFVCQSEFQRKLHFYTVSFISRLCEMFLSIWETIFHFGWWSGGREKIKSHKAWRPVLLLDPVCSELRVACTICDRIADPADHSSCHLSQCNHAVLSPFLPLITGVNGGRNVSFSLRRC